MLLPSLLYVLAIFIFLLITQEIFHRYPRFTFALFLMIPAILFACWLLLVNYPDWFPWVKVASIALGIFVLSVFRSTRLGNSRLCQLTIYLFLVINILEAVIRDFLAGGVGNYFNAIAGLLLLLTLNQIRTIYIDKKKGYNDLHWGSMTLLWIIGYTIWNWVFVYLNYGLQSSVQHIAVLGSALLIGFINTEKWLQARVFTLGTYFIIIHSAPHLNYQLFSSDIDKNFGLLVATVSITFMVWHTLQLVRSGDKKLLLVKLLGKKIE